MPKLDQLMEKELLFKKEGLSIQGLTRSAKVPEYRLRQHINQSLGYRNFNQYLNTYRIKLAKDILGQPKFQNEKK